MSPGGRFGAAIASAGDVNGDGYADLVAGAMGAREVGSGGAFVYRGGPDGIASTPSIASRDPESQDGAEFGAAVASAVDVDGDGFTDLWIGAPSRDAGAMNEGNVFLCSGSARGVRARAALVLDSPRNESNAGFGGSVASSDVNGDGYADLVVTTNSSVFVYYSDASGVPLVPSIALDNPVFEP